MLQGCEKTPTAGRPATVGMCRPPSISMMKVKCDLDFDGQKGRESCHQSTVDGGKNLENMALDTPKTVLSYKNKFPKTSLKTDDFGWCWYVLYTENIPLLFFEPARFASWAIGPENPINLAMLLGDPYGPMNMVVINDDHHIYIWWLYIYDVIWCYMVVIYIYRSG